MGCVVNATPRPLYLGERLGTYCAGGWLGPRPVWTGGVNLARCNNVSKFYYSIFIWSSTCFGRHNAHHQEHKTALAASGFSYMKGCWTCSWWTLSGTVCPWQRPPTTRPTTFHVWKTRGCQCSFRLLMMGGVLPKTCWGSYKYGIIRFWYIVASCSIFLYESYNDARIHEHQMLCLYSVRDRRMCMQQPCNDSDRLKPKYSELNLSTTTTTSPLVSSSIVYIHVRII